MNQETFEIATAAVQRYAESHPRPVQVNQVQAAEMLGICHVTLRKLVRSGKIKLNDCGLISISEIDRVLASES